MGTLAIGVVFVWLRRVELKNPFNTPLKSDVGQELPFLPFVYRSIPKSITGAG